MKAHGSHVNIHLLYIAKIPLFVLHVPVEKVLGNTKAYKNQN